LLTVLAIVALVAGLLFPVLASVRSAAVKANCISNMRQANAATMLYTADYDDYFMPVNHRPGAAPNSVLDRTWVQLLLPYTSGGFSIFTCPGDPRPFESADTVFDGDLQPGDIYARYYTASLHVNMGYNYLYLAPIVLKPSPGHWPWVCVPRATTSIADSSKTLLFADSVWDRLSNGTPVDGGSWLVVPPCRYAHRTGDSFQLNAEVFAPYKGWDVDNPNSAHFYGNAWPWHSGRINLVMVDGSAKSWPIQKLSEGCNVKESWRGFIEDPGDYPWDFN